MFGLDWKNANNYKPLLKHPEALWAWEFLRRNPEYQAHWNRIFTLYKQGKDRRSKYIKEIRDKSQRASNSLGLTNKLAFVPEDLMIDDPTHYCFFLMDKNAKKWGIPSLYNPLNPYPRHFIGRSFPLVVYGSEHPLTKLVDKSRDMKDNEFALIIDLEKSINPQLDLAREHLLHVQEKYKLYNKKRLKTYPVTWIRYLRILDASADGIKRKEAAPIIFRDQVGAGFQEFFTFLSNVNNGKFW